MLNAPLSQRQITTAADLRRRLPTWSTTDDALNRLAQRMPGFELAETLIKTAAINQLYGTKLYAVQRMAEHITQVMGSTTPGPALVERIACVPLEDGKRSSRYFSFASKFCRFFVDSETCPIFDRYAVWTVHHHLGRSPSPDAEHPYTEFVRNTRQLLDESGVKASAVELDSYLWIRGAFEAWRRKPNMQLNADLKALFERNPPQLKVLL